MTRACRGEGKQLVPYTLGATAPLSPRWEPATLDARWSTLLVPRLIFSPMSFFESPVSSGSFTLVGPPIIQAVEIRVGNEVWDKAEWCENCHILHGREETCAAHQQVVKDFIQSINEWFAEKPTALAKL